MSCESAPFMRTVANTLSIGFEVRRCVQCSAGKSKNVSIVSRSLRRQSTALSYLGAYFSANVAMAKSATARSGDNQISRKSLCALDCTDFGSLSRMFSGLCVNSLAVESDLTKNVFQVYASAAAHQPRYAAFLTPSSPTFRHSSPKTAFRVQRTEQPWLAGPGHSPDRLNRSVPSYLEIICALMLVENCDM